MANLQNNKIRLVGSMSYNQAIADYQLDGKTGYLYFTNDSYSYIFANGKVYATLNSDYFSTPTRGALKNYIDSSIDNKKVTFDEGSNELIWDTNVTLATVDGNTIDAKLPANPINGLSNTTAGTGYFVTNVTQENGKVTTSFGDLIANGSDVNTTYKKGNSAKVVTDVKYSNGTIYAYWDNIADTHSITLSETSEYSGYCAPVLSYVSVDGHGISYQKFEAASYSAVKRVADVVDLFFASPDSYNGVIDTLDDIVKLFDGLNDADSYTGVVLNSAKSTKIEFKEYRDKPDLSKASIQVNLYTYTNGGNIVETTSGDAYINIPYADASTHGIITYEVTDNSAAVSFGSTVTLGKINGNEIKFIMPNETPESAFEATYSNGIKIAKHGATYAYAPVATDAQLGVIKVDNSTISAVDGVISTYDHKFTINAANDTATVNLHYGINKVAPFVISGDAVHTITTSTGGSGDPFVYITHKDLNTGTVGYVGNNTTLSPVHGGSIIVPKLLVDKKGHVTYAGETTITLPTESGFETSYTTGLKIAQHGDINVHVPVAINDRLGVIKTGYTETNTSKAVKATANGDAYVEIPELVWL